MTKRKAEISLEEWLVSRVDQTDTDRTSATEATAGQAATPQPTVTTGPPEVKSE